MVDRFAPGVIAAACLLWLASAGVFARQPQSLFTDITSESGLDFIHVNGASGELLLPEVIGAGGALFDYDNDGDLDLFAVQGTTLKAAAAAAADRGGAAPRSRLYRNDRAGAAPPRFTDV